MDDVYDYTLLMAACSDYDIYRMIVPHHTGIQRDIDSFFDTTDEDIAADIRAVGLDPEDTFRDVFGDEI